MNRLAASAALASAGALLSLQIVGGLEATAGASLYTQSSMVGAMLATAALPVFVHVAWRRAKAVAVALFVGFVAFLAYSLPATVGRTGEPKHQKASSSVMIGQVQSDLDATVKRLEWARSDWMAECRSGAGPSCKGKGQTVQALEARVEKLRGQVVSAPAGDLGSELWSWASGGVLTVSVIRNASVLAFAVGLEMSIWALVWLATVLLSRPTVSATVSRAGDLTIDEGTTDAELEELRKLLMTHRRPLTNNEVAHLMGCHKSEASKRVSKAIRAGLVHRRRDGREVAIALH